MKRIAITTAPALLSTLLLALSLAAPAFAESQLERSVGASAGQYTTAQLGAMHFAASDTGLDAKLYFGPNNGHSARAAEIFARLSDEDTGPQGLPVLAGKPASPSTKGGHNATAARIFAEMLAAEDATDK